MTARSFDGSAHSHRASVQPSPSPSDRGPIPPEADRRVVLARLAGALAHLDRLGVDVLLDGPGDRLRYVVEGRALTECGVVALAVRHGFAAA